MSTIPAPQGRVLILAGSDSGGGAGIQADIKAVTMLGGYAATAITAVTVQNTLGVSGVHPIPVDIVQAQARAVLSDIGADALKTGMLGDVAMVEAVAQILDEAAGVPAVVDPVMVAKGGHPLLPDAAVEAVRRLMIPRAALLTPNTPEAEALTGLTVRDLDGQRRAGEALLNLGAKAVLMKGGHGTGAMSVDHLVTREGHAQTFAAQRIATRNTHGTGCTLSSAIAGGLARGLTLSEAVTAAKDYLTAALMAADRLAICRLHRVGRMWLIFYFPRLRHSTQCLRTPRAQSSSYC